MERSYLLFLSSLAVSRTTGAAGMLNHHSLNLLDHLSVLALLGAEYLVNTSKNIRRMIYFKGRKARIKAARTSATATLSVACYAHERSMTVYLQVATYARSNSNPTYGKNSIRRGSKNSNIMEKRSLT